MKEELVKLMELFRELRDKNAQGQISEEEFRQQLNAAFVEDEANPGRWWGIEPGRGRWIYHNGSTWVEATPPGFSPVAGAPPPVAAPAAASPQPQPAPAPQYAQPQRFVSMEQPGVVRPAGSIVIGVLCLVFGSFGLLNLFFLNELTAMVFGFKVPLLVAQIFAFAVTSINIYCGVGILLLQMVANRLLLAFSVFNIIQYLFIAAITTLNADEAMRAAQVETYELGAEAAKMFFLFGIFIATGIVIGLNIFFIYYMVSRAKYFVN